MRTHSLDFELLYEAVAPSVVSVYVGSSSGARGAGSGFVYDRRHVVTNDHVVRDEREVHVRLADGRWRAGRVVGTDAYTDLAVVRVPDLPDDAPPLTVAADVPEPGRPVAALGNPMGLDGSVSAGIVSGVNRSMATRGGFAIPDVVQTDAPINPGNSGGPLVARSTDAGGDVGLAEDDNPSTGEAKTDPQASYEVVGVNRAKGGDNIGFAISSRLVNRVVPALVEDGVYRHSYLRARTLDATPAIAEANGLPEPGGVLVVDAGDDGLRGCDRTARVGGREVPVGGDVVVAIDGEPVQSGEELIRLLIVDTEPGDSVDVTVLREGVFGDVTVPVELRERPGTADSVPIR
ncbi:trypsin-like peptidase domain-containing protein [Halorarum halophilum]|uniref:Trypsin-like peptidase domain-containing protein n=1 Tax=Halorarum halophilum TaxID=2743090 RepID=A0A7D5GFA9_9EURY|nr:trypsin-like peptidase domain-containing protein [Halobaculum halophilum]QLG27590.1 trypsin-like peptidase domain-containing protein [Halobaculum halophilum]